MHARVRLCQPLIILLVLFFCPSKMVFAKGADELRDIKMFLFVGEGLGASAQFEGEDLKIFKKLETLFEKQRDILLKLPESEQEKALASWKMALSAYKAARLKLEIFLLTDADLGMDVKKAPSSWRIDEKQRKILLLHVLYQAMQKLLAQRASFSNKEITDTLAHVLQQKGWKPSHAGGLSGIYHWTASQLFALRLQILGLDAYGFDSLAHTLKGDKEVLRAFHERIRPLYDDYLKVVHEFNELKANGFKGNFQGLKKCADEIQRLIALCEECSSESFKNGKNPLESVDSLKKNRLNPLFLKDFLSIKNKTSSDLMVLLLFSLMKSLNILYQPLQEKIAAREERNKRIEVGSEWGATRFEVATITEFQNLKKQPDFKDLEAFAKSNALLNDALEEYHGLMEAFIKTGALTVEERKRLGHIVVEFKEAQRKSSQDSYGMPTKIVLGGVGYVSKGAQSAVQWFLGSDKKKADERAAVLGTLADIASRVQTHLKYGRAEDDQIQELEYVIHEFLVVIERILGVDPGIIKKLPDIAKYMPVNKADPSQWVTALQKSLGGSQFYLAQEIPRLTQIFFNAWKNKTVSTLFGTLYSVLLNDSELIKTILSRIVRKKEVIDPTPAERTKWLKQLQRNLSQLKDVSFVDAHELQMIQSDIETTQEDSDGTPKEITDSLIRLYHKSLLAAKREISELRKANSVSGRLRELKPVRVEQRSLNASDEYEGVQEKPERSVSLGRETVAQRLKRLSRNN